MTHMEVRLLGVCSPRKFTYSEVTSGAPKRLKISY